jgi:cytochrome b subunit of formate dehydrogenase
MNRKTREWVLILLTISTLLFMVSGMGITEYNLMGFITFGLLTKDRSYLIHSILLYPFTALLFLHIYYTVAPRLRGNKPSQ